VIPLLGIRRTQAGAVLWVVIIIAVIPWRHVFTQYVTEPAEPWRRSRQKPPALAGQVAPGG
jgi:hypothetical protein